MKAIQYGAGNIGRGFIAQLFRESGYEVVFAEVSQDLVERLNTDNCYPIRIVSNDSSCEITVDGVRAVNGADVESVSSEIVDADIIATAVGVGTLPKISKTIAYGLSKRWASKNMKPLNIIICENLLDADKYLYNLIASELGEDEIKYLGETVGFVKASIGRMVPVMTEEMQEGNPLRIWVEEYCKLPVDKNGFKGEVPNIKNMNPISPFEFYIQEKLFIHNAGHAMAAYLGNLKKHTYIWECYSDETIVSKCRKALMESAQALAIEHNVPLEGIQSHIEDLIFRFGNRGLGDTVARVGRDPKRKLSPNDRLIGACRLALKHNIKPEYLSEGVAAGMLFNRQDDLNSREIQDMIKSGGADSILREVCCLSPDEPLWDLVLSKYNYLISSF